MTSKTCFDIFFALLLSACLISCTTTRAVKIDSATSWNKQVSVGDDLLVTTKSGRSYSVKVDEIGEDLFIGRVKGADNRLSFSNGNVRSIEREEVSAARSTGAVLGALAIAALVALAVILSRVDIEE